MTDVTQTGKIKNAAKEEGSMSAEPVDLLDLAEAAWGLIAYVYATPGGSEAPDWRFAAEKWRDNYHAALDAAKDAL